MIKGHSDIPSSFILINEMLSIRKSQWVKQCVNNKFFLLQEPYL